MPTSSGPRTLQVGGRNDADIPQPACLDGGAAGEDGHVVDAQRHVLVVPPAALVGVEDLVAQLLACLHVATITLCTVSSGHQGCMS